jgi:hypothetical protein
MATNVLDNPCMAPVCDIRSLPMLTMFTWKDYINDRSPGRLLQRKHLSNLYKWTHTVSENSQGTVSAAIKS